MSSSSLSSSDMSSSETLFTGTLALGGFFACFSSGQQYFGHSLAHTILQTDGQPYDRGWGVMSRDVGADVKQHCGEHSVVHFLRHVAEHASEECLGL